MTYVYYVCFLFGAKGESSGSGYTKIERQQPISTFEDVIAIVQELEEQGLKGVTIVNWKRLD